MGGIGLIPLMIGMFAVSEIMRFAVDTDPPLKIVDQPIGNVFKGMWALTKKYPLQILRGSALGTLVGALPGAGADIAAWMSYAMSKKFSKEPEKFGTGHVEGIVESGSANNSALAGAWIPALVFGIPGRLDHGDRHRRAVHEEHEPRADAVHAKSAEHLRGLPAVHHRQPHHDSARAGGASRCAKQILKVPRNVLMPVILLFCIVGAFAINNTVFDVGVMLVAGVVAYVLEENGFPVAPAILGVVLGGMLEENFVTSMIKSDGDLLAFFSRPLAAALGALTLSAWFLPPVIRRLRRLAGV